MSNNLLISPLNKYCKWCKSSIDSGFACASCTEIMASTFICIRCDNQVFDQPITNRLLNTCVDCREVELAKNTKWKDYFTKITNPKLRLMLYKCQKSFVFFISLYGFKLADFHEEIVAIFTNPKKTRILIEIPREHGKSTLVELFCAWILLFNPAIYIMIFSYTFKQATDRSKNIKKLISGKDPAIDQVVRDLFGHLEHRMRWGDEEFYLYNMARLTVAGVGKEVLGTREGFNRPNYLICDDIVSAKMEMSDRKVELWFKEVMTNLGGPHTKIIVVGTPYRKTDIMSKLKTNPLYKSEKGTIIHYEALLGQGMDILLQDDVSNVPVLWEAYFPASRLKEKLMEIESRIIFIRNFLCRAVASGAQVFPEHIVKPNADFFNFVFNKNDLPHNYYKYIVGGVDLSISADTGADFFVVVVLGVTYSGRYEIIWGERHHGATYVRQKQILVDLDKRYLFDLLLIESNAYQQVLEQELAETTDMMVEGYTTGREKHDLEKGLPNIRTHFEHRRLKYPDETEYEEASPEGQFLPVLMEELYSYIFNEEAKVEDTGPHNDTVMALWFATIAARKMTAFSITSV